MSNVGVASCRGRELLPGGVVGCIVRTCVPLGARYGGRWLRQLSGDARSESVNFRQYFR